ncbi:site-specific DNA-methyltransferase [Halomonas sp. M20]|uniref:site-specific DNA-methyltransferase n=1 Tax=Halomonas sp. M20 TaxID=2763264 RepID=UPI001D09ADE6|nr:site-specific DNA-methyltransferase [Halomonas sp. M20]
MDKLKMHSPNLTEDSIAKLAELFPSCVTEARDEQGRVKQAIDFDQLRQELSDHIVDGPQERYHLNWPGKREALLAANAPIAKTLRPCREESVDFDNTKNLFIEGDNLEALKLLQETYLGKVKVIYIDPPYNTGNDFVYHDKYCSTVNDYLNSSLQKDEHGERLVANPETSGRFHSDWLSMMYPRLRLAKNLLRDDGVIFISIDDGEVSGLIKVCEEIFGGENFVGSVSWRKKRKGSFLSKKIVSVTEWLLVFSKSPDIKLYGGKADEAESQPLIKRTNPVGKLVFPEGSISTRLNDGVYEKGVYGNGSSAVELLDDTEVSNGFFSTSLFVKGPFVWSQSYLDDQFSKGATFTVNTINFQIRAFKAPDENSFKGLSSLIDGVEFGATNEAGYEQLKWLLEAEGIMSYPKPFQYIEILLDAAAHWDHDALVMDFFSGSSTTGHAVMSLNSKDGGNRRHIAIQLAEECEISSAAYQAGYTTVAEIGKERLRRSGQNILQGEHHSGWLKDVGFRVFKLDNSNMDDIWYSPDGLKQSDILGLVDNIRKGRTSEDLLFQILLDWGVDLSLPISRQELDGKTVFFVDGDEKYMALAACFDLDIDEAFVKQLAEYEPLRVVFRDAGFASDSVKINVEQVFAQKSPNTEVKVI